MRHSNIFRTTLWALSVLALAQTASAQCSSGHGGGSYTSRVQVQPAPVSTYTPAPVVYPQVTQYPQTIQRPQVIRYSRPVVKTVYRSTNLFGNSGTSLGSDKEQYGIYVTNPLNGEESLFKTVTGLRTARSLQSRLERRFFVMYFDADQQKYKEARSERDAETVKQDLRARGYRVTNVAKVLVRIGSSGEDSLDGLFESGGQEPTISNPLDMSQSSKQGSASQAPSQTNSNDDTMQLLAGNWSAPGKIGDSELGVIQLKLLSNGFTRLTFRTADGEETVRSGQASIEDRRLKLRVDEQDVDFGMIESMDQNSFLLNGPDGEYKFLKNAS